MEKIKSAILEFFSWQVIALIISSILLLVTWKLNFSEPVKIISGWVFVLVYIIHVRNIKGDSFLDIVNLTIILLFSGLMVAYTLSKLDLKKIAIIILIIITIIVTIIQYVLATRTLLKPESMWSIILGYVAISAFTIIIFSGIYVNVPLNTSNNSQLYFIQNTSAKLNDKDTNLYSASVFFGNPLSDVIPKGNQIKKIIIAESATSIFIHSFLVAYAIGQIIKKRENKV